MKNRLPATNLKFLLLRNKSNKCWNFKNKKKWMFGRIWNPWLKIVWPRSFGRIWKPIFDHSTIFRKLLTRPLFFSLCVAKNPNQVISPVTGCIRRLPASFVIGRSPAHIISCRLCICRSPAAFLAKFVFVSKYLLFRLNEKAGYRLQI